MTTTLNKIVAKNPCKEFCEKLLKGLNKTKADDEELDYLIILETNGLNDTLWCLDKVENMQKELRLFAVWCARKNRHLFEGEELEKFDSVLDIAERYANGLATMKERDSAWDYTRAYALNSAWASARATTGASAWATARDSAVVFDRSSVMEEIIKHFKETVLQIKEE